MNGIFRHVKGGVIRFFTKKYCRRLIYLFFLGIPVFVEFLTGGFVRRTFVFYVRDTGEAEVEERLLPRMPSQELAVRQYIEEALLGPVSPEAEFLFPRETGLISLLFREGVVYADFSLSAALPYSGSADVFRNLYVIHSGIRRNFDFVQDVRLFIDGKEAYYERFRGISHSSFKNGAYGKSVFWDEITNVASKMYKYA
jgi:hypothetical protein